jgi:hypothetical protein
MSEIRERGTCVFGNPLGHELEELKIHVGVAKTAMLEALRANGTHSF